ncbi:MAG: hypothetical protein OXC31_21585 [Spirochaetaceae bacterium]|nr:hypothetical protein [Spirochaetaceae bacterium]
MGRRAGDCYRPPEPSSKVRSRTAPPPLTLGELAQLSPEEEALLGAASSGFYSREWARNRFFRWTTDTARLSVPLDPAARPSALTVEVLMTGPPKQLQITVDGCRLLDETIRGGWTQTLALDDCRIDPPTIEIELTSDVHVPSTRDNRGLGVAIASIELSGGAE